MSFKNVWSTVSLVSLLGITASALKFSSPCPDIFRYDSVDQPNEWTATLTMLTDFELHGVWLRLIFNEKLTELDVHNNFGEVVPSEDNKEFLVKNKHYLLKENTPIQLKITVKYEGSGIPTLTGFRLNAKMVCPPKSGSFGQLYIGDENNHNLFPSLMPLQGPETYKEPESCGITPLLKYQEFDNKNLQNSQWPWQGAIYIGNNNSLKYICEATLISSRHVLTPAHCVTYQKSELVVPVHQLSVYLGKYNNNTVEDKNVQKFQVEKIVVHPGYRAANLLSDLAIVHLKKAIVTDDYVRPVCLNNVGDKTDGFLTGFNMKEHALTVSEVSLISDEECLQKNSKLKHLLNDNVVCASYPKDDATCVGNSGSSLVTLRQGQNPVWDLKGIVTVGITVQEKAVCNRGTVVLLENVHRYLKWIRATTV